MTARVCRGVHHFKNLPSFSVTHSMKMAISVRPEDRLHNVEFKIVCHLSRLPFVLFHFIQNGGLRITGRSHYHGLKTNCLAHIFDGFEMDKSEFMRVGEVTNYFLSTFSIMSVSMSLAIGSGFQEGCRTMYLHSFA